MTPPGRQPSSVLAELLPVPVPRNTGLTASSSRSREAPAADPPAGDQTRRFPRVNRPNTRPLCRVPGPVLGPRPGCGALTAHGTRFRQDRSTRGSTPELSTADRCPHRPAAGCPPRRLPQAARQSSAAPVTPRCLITVHRPFPACARLRTLLRGTCPTAVILRPEAMSGRGRRTGSYPAASAESRHERAISTSFASRCTAAAGSGSGQPSATEALSQDSCSTAQAVGSIGGSMVRCHASN